MGSGRGRQRPIEYRPPTDATIKQLYGTAFRCAKPSCLRPLYRLNNDTGETILNSRVAHIHARSEGGPRWNPQMSEEENRGAANLVPLCEEHAFEIDATPNHFPADLLRQWKNAQLAEYQQIGKSWPLSDAEVAEVATESFDPDRTARADVAASTVVGVARLIGSLLETGRRQRRLPAVAAATWKALCDQTTARMPAWDDDGELLRVEPSLRDKNEHRAALRAALAEAVASVENTASGVIAELHAVRASDPRLASWCDWVERSVQELALAAGRWPGDLAADDDGVWPNALDEVRRASEALTARWRGEDATEPPEPPPSVGQPAETEQQRAVREHHELLDAARPWARVTHRPFNPELYQRLAAATTAVAHLPDTMSLLSTGLEATARLAARVARNADDPTFRELITGAGAITPLAAAVTLVRQLMFIAKDADRPELEAEALDDQFQGG